MNHQTPERSHERQKRQERPAALSAQAIELLKRAYPIQDVLARYGIALPGASLHRMACCPFHEDTHPSMGVFLDTNRFFCFRCGAKGDVLDLIQRLEGIPFREAVTRLGDQAPQSALESDQRRAAGQPEQRLRPIVAPLPALDTTQLSTGADPNRRREDTQLNTTVLTVAAAVYQERLLRTPHALAYLHTRGIPLAVALRARLGYADATTLHAFVGEDAVMAAVARQVGLLDVAGRDRMRGRLVIPEFRAGRCVWMVGRNIPATSTLPAQRQRPSADTSSRQTSTAGTSTLALFPKYLGVALPKPLLGVGLVISSRHTPHLTEKHQRAARDRSHARGVLVVEGPFDLLTALVWRLPVRCVALVGTYANVQQVAEIVALANGGPIWLALDADAAGATGATRLQAQLSEAGCAAQIQWLHIPEHAKDLSEIVMSPSAHRLVELTLTDAAAGTRKGGW